ncbi:hypothetical protein [Francisella sciaenopsi]|uniref:Uncharacterized protein n=1 Tax=Francisella sciaenopsi TaxID=3055034 RepID=A0ABQ6PHP1_9GAMM
MGKYINKISNKYDVYSGLPEFGYELIATLPYVYSLYLKNVLNSTVSGLDTACLYYFSTNHTEIQSKRSFDNVVQLRKESFPSIRIHAAELDWDNFSPPPLQEFYADKAIKFSKPTIVISNRRNLEWGKQPRNYLSENTLLKLFELLNNTYQIIYIDSAHFGADYEDHVEFMDGNVSQKYLDNYGVLTLKNLKLKYKDLSLNEIQCRLYAGCDKFISSNGGLGILASYFGGENIIFSKACQELNPSVNSFNHWYPKFSKAIIKVVRNEDNLIDIVKMKWMDCKPLINIIITTKGSPDRFHDCMSSIYNQSYKNINIIIGIGDELSRRYVQGHSCTIVELYDTKYDNNQYELIDYASAGYIIHVDDSSVLNSNFISNIADIIISDNPEIVVCSSFDALGNISIYDMCYKSSSLSALMKNHISFSILNKNFIKDVTISVLSYCHDMNPVQKQKPPLVILITCDDSHTSIDQCLSSILNAVDIVDFEVKVIVGTYITNDNIRDDVYKYEHCFEFYRVVCEDKSILLNSLLSIIKREDSLILYLSANSILSSKILDTIYKNAYSFVLEFGLNFLLEIDSINVTTADYERALSKNSRDITMLRILDLIKKNDYDAAISYLLDIIITGEPDVFVYDFLKKIADYRVIIQSPSSDNIICGNDDLSYICSYGLLKRFGFFNRGVEKPNLDFKKRISQNIKNGILLRDAPILNILDSEKILNCTHEMVQKVSATFVNNSASKAIIKNVNIYL